MIDMQRLRVLREVAEHGSFSKAAAALLLTPSAVSQQIAALERSLGTVVVERGARGAVLTEPGRMLVETADLVLAELRHTQERIGRLASGHPDRLTVATFASGGQRLLPAALQRLATKHPGIELTVLEYDPVDSLPLVRAGKADVALAYHFDGPPPVRKGDRSGLEWTPVMDDPMWIVLPVHHRLADRPTLPLAELSRERWVHGCLTIGERIDLYAALAGFEIEVACNTTDYVFAQSLIAAGVGVGLVPEVALTKRKELVAIELEAPRPSRFIGVITARRRHEHPLVQDLLAALAS